MASERILDQHEQKDRTRLEWLRSAVREGIDAIDRGDYTELKSEGALKNFLRLIREDCPDVLPPTA